MFVGRYTMVTPTFWTPDVYHYRSRVGVKREECNRKRSGITGQTMAKAKHWTKTVPRRNKRFVQGLLSRTGGKRSIWRYHRLSVTLTVLSVATKSWIPLIPTNGVRYTAIPPSPRFMEEKTHAANIVNEVHAGDHHSIKL